MTYQVEGSFADGVGEIIGEEMFQGKVTRLRFLWTELDTDTPRWEHAYFDESAGEWEAGHEYPGDENIEVLLDWFGEAIR
jgi:hypothetical protein